MKSPNNELEAFNNHLSQFKELSTRLQKQLNPILEVQKQFEKALNPMLEIQKAIESPFERFLETQKKLITTIDKDKISRLVSPDYSLPNLPELESYQKSLQSLISPAFENIQRSFDKLSPQLQNALYILADHGWFLDLEIPLSALWELEEALLNNDSEAEEALIDYFEEELNRIETSINERLPHRAHIISSAFKAHRREEYALSIPVFLAQTDGICKETVHHYFFMKHQKKPQTAKYVEQITTDAYEAALLSPLARVSPIGASEKDRNGDVKSLNRHTVLHGESLNYDTKTNSLKAVSLLNYVVHALPTDTKPNN